MLQTTSKVTQLSNRTCYWVRKGGAKGGGGIELVLFKCNQLFVHFLSFPLHFSLWFPLWNLFSLGLRAKFFHSLEIDVRIIYAHTQLILYCSIDVWNVCFLFLIQSTELFIYSGMSDTRERCDLKNNTRICVCVFVGIAVISGHIITLCVPSTKTLLLFMLKLKNK